jgi:hypothetical protein
MYASRRLYIDEPKAKDAHGNDIEWRFVSDTSSPTYSGSGALRIGYGSFGTDSIAIDDVYIFTEALDPMDASMDVKIKFNMNQEYRTACMLQLLFNDQEEWTYAQYGEYRTEFVPSTSTLQDLSGKDNHVTVVGADTKLTVTYICILCQ